jgi:hypothetical protein
MTEVPITRDRHAIEQDIANAGMKISRQLEPLRLGETPEQIGDVPGALKQAAGELLRLAGELAEVWPKPQ